MPVTKRHKITPISYKQLERQFTLNGYWVGDKFFPAITKHSSGYTIRVVEQNIHNFVDFFNLDNTGLIITSPRGLSEKFNHRVRITDIDAGVSAFQNRN
jgi:hypothetical protein